MSLAPALRFASPKSSPKERALKGKAVNFVAFLNSLSFGEGWGGATMRLHRTHIKLREFKRSTSSRVQLKSPQPGEI